MTPRPVSLEILGRPVQVQSDVPREELETAKSILEETFQAMDSACRVRWGGAPVGSDTTSWLLLGALNLAHRVARLEREANQHTQDLEKTLSKYLSDVPDDMPRSMPILMEDDD